MFSTVNLKELKKHPWYKESKNGLYLFPTKDLAQIGKPNPTETTDTGDGSGQQFSSAKVWDTIIEQGMRDPFYVLVSIPNPNSKENATIRLEAGNHRVKEALKNGVTHLPVAAFMQSYPIYHPGNGQHRYPLEKELIHSYYESLGRNPKWFDPYPQPVDLKVLLPHLKIFNTKEVKIVEEKGGIIIFSP